MDQERFSKHESCFGWRFGGTICKFHGAPWEKPLWARFSKRQTNTFSLFQVAKELAAAGIPIILTEDRGGPTTFRTKDALVGPPLTRSIASYLKEAGVQVGFALLEPRKFFFFFLV